MDDYVKKIIRKNMKKTGGPSLIKRPGRVKEYMLKKYGIKAFFKNGTLKVSYLRKALNECRSESMKKAIRLAITMITKWHKK